jgi:hypothetical protein
MRARTAVTPDHKQRSGTSRDLSAGGCTSRLRRIVRCKPMKFPTSAHPQSGLQRRYYGSSLPADAALDLSLRQTEGGHRASMPFQM